ncbi:MAG: hypothetical protein EZS28_048730, partial [Streblomastix strix]
MATHFSSPTIWNLNPGIKDQINERRDKIQSFSEYGSEQNMHHWWHQRTTAGDLASSKPQIVMELKNKEDKEGRDKQMTEYDEYVNEQEGYQQDDLNVEQKDNIELSDEDDYEEYYEDDEQNAEDIKGSIKLDDKKNQLTNLNNGNKEEDVAKSAVSTNSANFIIPPPIPIITASQI